MRARSAGITFVEGAIGLSLALSVAAVAVPAFVRNLVSSKLVEPVDGLGRIGSAACALVAAGQAVPPSAPLTPAEVPRGQRVVDPPATWESPTWRALAFHPSENGAPHAFSFVFDDTTTAQAQRASGPAALPNLPTNGPVMPPLPVLHPSFAAASHGDLDGDGVTSSFEIHSQPSTGDAAGPLQVDPEMYIEAEVE